MRNKLLSFALISLSIVMVLSMIFTLSHAQTSGEEAAQLEKELSDSGYGWLSNYTLSENGGKYL